MSDLRKAAEMALEALDEYTCVVTSGTDPTKWDEVVDGGGPAREAIDALRQALAQPEQERLYTEKDIVAVVEAIVTSFDLRRSEHLRHLIEAKLKEKNT